MAIMGLMLQFSHEKKITQSYLYSNVNIDITKYNFELFITTIII